MTLEKAAEIVGGTPPTTTAKALQFIAAKTYLAFVKSVRKYPVGMQEGANIALKIRSYHQIQHHNLQVIFGNQRIQIYMLMALYRIRKQKKLSVYRMGRDLIHQHA